jgi:hypothetical protein
MGVRMKIYQPSTKATVILLIVFACALIVSQMHATARNRREEITQAVLIGGATDEQK